MTANTMSDAIALASPSGRMSNRAKKAAQKRLSVALFGPDGLRIDKSAPQPAKRDCLLRDAARYREYAAAGMRPRANIKLAAALEAEAADLADS